ncbi:MAG TPA: hypothetical protein VH350_01730 [Candidatus Sulfotelmatobacter sp.]|nr:hypothetical protein [Candidatus Sulfotelmatobacter sp.]
MPATNARPRRIALAPDGTIYYTDFARGYLGHFDPRAGKLMKEWASPGGAQSEPYGIAVTSDGDVWYSESGVKPNTLVRFDPKSESFSTKAIPSGGGVVRNMVATPDRRLYLACSGVNKVAVVDLNRWSNALGTRCLVPDQYKGFDMLFRSYKPSPPLSDFIENFWLYDGYDLSPFSGEDLPERHVRNGI